MNFLEQLPEVISKKGDDENTWSKASVSIDVSSKIYGYRVDSLHNQAFKMVGFLHRGEALNKNLDLAAQLLKDAEDGLNGKTKVKGVCNKKFYAGERTLEKDIANLDKDMMGLEFEIDPLFHHITAKFDESKTSSFLLNSTPINGEVELAFFQEGTWMKGSKDNYWRLLDPVQAAKKDLSDEDERIRKGIKEKKTNTFVSSVENDKTMLQRMFKKLLISISKFSVPPIRKMVLFYEIEPIMYKKLKYHDKQCSKLIKSLYASHKKNNKRSTEDEIIKHEKRPKIKECELESSNNRIEEYRSQAKNEEIHNISNTGVENSFHNDTNYINPNNDVDTNNANIELKHQNELEEKDKIFSKNEANIYDENKENNHNESSIHDQDFLDMDENIQFDQFSQESKDSKAKSILCGNEESKDAYAEELFQNIDKERTGEAELNDDQTNKQEVRAKWFLEEESKNDKQNAIDLNSLKKAKNIGTGVQNKKLKHREEIVAAQIGKSKKFTKDENRKFDKRTANTLENSLFNRDQIENEAERIQQEEREIKKKKRELKFKALATATLDPSDFENFLIDNNKKEKKRFKYPLIKLTRLMTQNIFYEVSCTKDVLSYHQKQSHLASLNEIDISKEPFEDFIFLEDNARSNIIMDQRQLMITESMKQGHKLKDFIRYETRKNVPFELRVTSDIEVNDEDKEQLYLTQQEKELGFKWSKANKKQDIKELKKSIWQFSDHKIPEKPKDAEQRKFMKQFTFLDVAEKFYAPQIFENQEENWSIHSLFVCMLHLANENKLWFFPDKSKGKKDMNFSIYKYEVNDQHSQASSMIA